MRYRPLSLRREYYHALLQKILERGWPSRITLAGPKDAKSRAGDPAAWVDAEARISVILKGRGKFAIGRDGKRRDCELRPGQALYWPPHAWNIPFWNSSFVFFGIVFRQSFTRYIVVEHQGGPAPAGNTPWAWHTRRPMGGAGIHMTRALNALAAERDEDPHLTRTMVLGLLHCAERHLALDGGEVEEGDSRKTWHLALEEINRRYADPMLSRESVAENIGVHPNYLSAVAAQYGEGFHAAMETVRMDRARQLLREKGRTMEEIARLCGYSGAVSFSRAFRRFSGLTPGTVRRQTGQGL